MGMYTEIYVNVNLKKETPDEIINVLQAMCSALVDQPVLKSFPKRWQYLFSHNSYYVPWTFCRHLTYDNIGEQWSLLGKGDIKNYENEIEAFFEWLMPWIDGENGDFIGYYRYEVAKLPTLVTLKGENR